MKTLFYFLAILFMFGFFAFSTAATSYPADGKLMIHFSMNGDMVYMHCLKGCSWDRLELDGSGEKTYLIDQETYRYLDSDKQLFEIKPGRDNFLFTVKKSEGGLSFVAHYGLNWLALTANCKSLLGNCIIKLDENGVEVDSSGRRH